MAKELRCPKCERPASPESLTYSKILDAFVCPACAAGAAAARARGEVPTPPPARQATKIPPPPSLIDRPAEEDPHEPPDVLDFAPAREPDAAQAPAPSVRSASAPQRKWSPLAVVVGAAVLVIALTTIIVSLSRHRAPTLDEQQRAWDEAHHDEIVALKSQAEALAIDGKLAEAHAKYREIEKLIGGRQVKEPTLFDIVEVARADQDRIYKIMLARMEKAAGTKPAIEEPGEKIAQAQAESPPGAGAAVVDQGIQPPKQSYPSRFNTLQPSNSSGGGGADADEPQVAMTPSAPAPGPAPAALTPNPSPATAPPAGPTPSPTPPTTSSVASTTAASRKSLLAEGSKLPTTADLRPDPDEATTQAAQAIEIATAKLTDEQVTQSIQRAVDFIYGHFRGGEVQVVGDEKLNEMQLYGIDALCVYSLANAGKAINDRRFGPKSPEMIEMLEKLKTYKLDTNPQFPQGPVTYARSLRACALATFNRPQDREVLADDVDWLVHAATDGAYTYDDRFSSPRKTRRRAQPQQDQPEPTTRRSGGRAAASADGDVYGPRAAATSFDEGAAIILTDGTFTPRPPIITPPKVFTNTLPRSSTPRTAEKYKSNFPWDNSNSQYGLLGVWAGAEVGIEVPDNYWRAVQRHWSSCQLPSGEWNYMGMGEFGRFSMTCAGIASLLVTHDYLDAPALGGKTGNGRQPYSPPLSAGLAWLEDNDNAINILAEPLFYVGYNLFGIERVGLASGFKQFGAHDWFIELASKTIPTQFANGSFGRDDEGSDTLIDTSYVLMFLSRGRNPILMNKLRFDGNWSNRPREIANLTNFAGRELERAINWQVVDITREPADWADAPILYIASNKAIGFGEAEMGKLSDFVDNGGIIFTHADVASAEFNKFVADLAKQLFPAYQFQDLPKDHELFKLNYNLPMPHPKLQGVSNGSRLLLIHCPEDISAAWQQRSTQSRKQAFQLGTNIYLYATGKEKFRNRLDTPIIPPPENQPLRTIPMARLKYQGNWDPEPGAWPRMGRKLQWDTGSKLDVKYLEIKELSFEQFHVAHVTGTDALNPTDEQTAAMKKFVDDGGTLLIDATGGSANFAQAAETGWLAKILGDAKLQPLDAKDPLLHHTIDGTVEMPEKALRLFAMEQLHSDGGRLKVAAVGKGRIVFSALDVTSGLLGTNTWGIVGYLPEYSEAVVKNLILIAAQ